ncbi:hypothetical protein BC829DRAFT_385074 [Chytridium lagenaria]|nr:hypothetical protein BC829DRAFT_385074 [Chytridium lagenaria]
MAPLNSLSDVELNFWLSVPDLSDIVASWNTPVSTAVASPCRGTTTDATTTPAILEDFQLFDMSTNGVFAPMDIEASSQADIDGDLMFDTYLNSNALEPSDSVDVSAQDLLAELERKPAPTTDFLVLNSTRFTFGNAQSLGLDDDSLNVCLPTPSSNAVSPAPSSPSNFDIEEFLRSQSNEQDCDSFSVTDGLNLDSLIAAGLDGALEEAIAAFKSSTADGPVAVLEKTSTGTSSHTPSVPLRWIDIVAEVTSPHPTDATTSPSKSSSPIMEVPFSPATGEDHDTEAVDPEEACNFILKLPMDADSGLFHCPHPGCTYEGASRRYNLKIHYLTHLGEATRRFTCSICYRRFRRRHDLDRHGMNLHDLTLKEALENGGPRNFRKATMERMYEDDTPQTLVVSVDGKLKRKFPPASSVVKRSKTSATFKPSTPKKPTRSRKPASTSSPAPAEGCAGAHLTRRHLLWIVMAFHRDSSLALEKDSGFLFFQVISL